MSYRLLCGDALDVLETLEPQSVHCVVTSPPYWGLRDYGTAEWQGGDPECDHFVPLGDGGAEKRTGYTVPFRTGTQYTHQRVFGDTCGKCGAERVDSQLGLEQSPDEYVRAMVTVFAAVWRVLRDDGTLWLNLGDSYAGGGRNEMPQESRMRLRTGLTPKQVAYVLDELAKHSRIVSATMDGDE